MIAVTTVIQNSGKTKSNRNDGRDQRKIIIIIKTDYINSRNDENSLRWEQR